MNLIGITIIEEISKELGECVTGSQLNTIFADLGIIDSGDSTTKWRRIHYACIQNQRITNSPSLFFSLTEKIMNPVRFINRQELFHACQLNINTILAFIGKELGNDGKLNDTVDKASTIKQAERRASELNDKLGKLNLHSEVKKYCKAELMQENYFHATLEAIKGLAERIREMTNIQADGVRLVDTAFSPKCPYVFFNTISTDSEKSIHNGFANILKGCFMLIRNPRAHDPKIFWNEDDSDTFDCLMLISMLHRKLDKAQFRINI